jgi:apolipoprotein N-acyltransferase
MIAILCVLLSAVGFYFSTGLGDQWWLLWLAPIPVLWYAFGDTKYWSAFGATFLAAALGTSNYLRAYAGTMPTFVLLLIILGPPLLFAGAAMGARRVHRALGAVAAMFAFAALWTMLDYFVSFDRAGGTMPTPSGAEVAAPMLIQTASLVSYLGVTFLIGAISAGIALSLRDRTRLPAAIAIALFVLNAGFGYWRMSEPAQQTLHVALVESDDTVGAIGKSDQARTMAAVDAYTAQIRKLTDKHVALVVLPENIARLDPAWRSAVEAKFQAAADASNATVVAGFNDHLDGAQRNISLGFTPRTTTPVTYEKRRLVQGLESPAYTPGNSPRALANGTGLEICKDMDFQDMIRVDEVATTPQLLAVPAWDFDKDDWAHARMAVFRSVENGVPMARNARDGLLTLNDRYGRIVARARTVGPFTTLIGDLPLDGRGGNTLYDRIGDVFGWFCAALGIGLVALSFLKRKSAT